MDTIFIMRFKKKTNFADTKRVIRRPDLT